MSAAEDLPQTSNSSNIAQHEHVDTVVESTGLSKRAQKRLARKQQMQEKKKKKKKEHDSTLLTQDQLEETSYYIENGLRKVYPYKFTFTVYAKGRWVGQQLLDVFVEEFHYSSKEIFEQAITDGLVTVNGNKINSEYKLKDNDFIENVVHRHELPVTAQELEILEDSEDVLVVNKPSSIPIHPCGRYRHNSLIYILAKEYSQANLRTFYRIDRLTSGLMIFPKTERMTAKLTTSVIQRNVTKTYVCKVAGQFPDEILVCEEPLGPLDFQLGLHVVDPNGKHAKTTFERLSYDAASDTSIVQCKPDTGRTHQIRVHLQWLGYPIINDPLYNSPVWGPQRGKGGQYGKPTDQLIQDLKVHHSMENLMLPVDEVPKATDQDPKPVNISQEPTGNDPEQDPAPKKPRLHKLPPFDAAKLTVDPNCRMCKQKFADPTPDKLVMYLHALTYKGPDWEYSTPLPEWARR